MYLYIFFVLQGGILNSQPFNYTWTFVPRSVFLLYIFCFTRWNLNSRPFYFTWYFVPRQVFCLAGIKEFFFFVCFDLVRRYVDFIRRNLEFSTLHGGYFLFSSTLNIVCIFLAPFLGYLCT